ncbi:MAG TPA: GNAT family N-acetyltransferase [Candidatus Lokiarchaeia archaeon]|nr:GNAT family N-acetyltransferase [Candidatus Lokiarchaeia archaeon]
MSGNAIAGPVQSDEIDAVLEGISASFSPEDGPVNVQNFCRILEYEPLVSLDYMRVVRVDGHIVAGVIIIPLFLRIGQATLKAAGLTGVATWRGHRHRGYASILMKDVHDFLAGRGFDIVVLNSGATELYLKLGYEMSHQSFSLNLPWENAVHLVEVADDLAGNFVVRRATPEDIPRLHEILFQNPVTPARRTYFLRTYARFYNKFMFYDQIGNPIWVVEETATGMIDAYGWENAGGYSELFSATDDTTHYRALIHHFVQQHGGPAAPSQISLCPLPEHERLIALVKEFGGSFLESPVSAKMCKLLVIDRVLHEMLPEWEWLIQSRSPPAVNCDFFIAIGPQTFHFIISNGHIDIIEINPSEEMEAPFQLRPQDLASAILGIAPAEDILEESDLYRGDPTRRQILDSMFPARKPFILSIDDY